MKRLACFFLFAAAATAQPRCSIRGTVIDALTGQPLARAQVFAYPGSDADDDDDALPPVRQISDSRGMFCFENLAAGDYEIAAKRSRYIDASYGQHWPGGAGQIVELSVGESVTPITIRMSPQAVIAGILLDADGDPVQRARIDLQKPRWKGGRLTAESVQQTTTDDQGRYRFAGLVAGAYFISTIPAHARENASPVVRSFVDQNGQPFRQVEGKTYYKDSISFPDATRVLVGAGQEVSNLTLTLRKAEARHVSGEAALGVLNTHPRILDLFQEDSGFWLNVPIQNDGRFLADGLFPDRYVIRGPGVARKEIDLTNGDIDGVILEPDEPIELQITVHLNGTHSLIRSLALVDKTPDTVTFGALQNAELVSENKFRLVVRPGRYEIGPANESPPYFFKGLTIDGDPQSRPILDLKGGGRKSIELFLSSNVASVEGRVIGKSGEEEVTFVQQDEADPDALVIRQFNSGEAFQWNFLQPGKYRLYAFEDFDPNSWGSPQLVSLLAPKSVVVEIKKEGQHQQVSLPLISTKEFQEALRKTGF